MYIELIILFNFYVDLLILLMTAILIKQKINFKKLLNAAILGSLSSFFLFLKITILELLILSFLISIFLIKIAFNNYKALFYFYFNAIIIGGFIFFINNQFKITTIQNYFILIIITPIIVIIYKFKIKDFKKNYNFNYQIKFNFNNQEYILNSFLDTGNTLIDPYFNKPVILINDSILKSDKYFYIPYSTISETGIIKAIYLNEIEIIGLKKITNVVIGLLPKKLQLKNIDCLLNNNLLEGYNV